MPARGVRTLETGLKKCTPLELHDKIKFLEKVNLQVRENRRLERIPEEQRQAQEFINWKLMRGAGQLYIYVAINILSGLYL